MFDQHSNFAYSTVVTPPSPEESGNRLAIELADKDDFPSVPFNCTVWPALSIPQSSNATIIRVTQKIGNVFIFERAQEGSNDAGIHVGDQIAATATKKLFTDIEQAIAGKTFLTMGRTGSDYNIGSDNIADVQMQAAVNQLASVGGGILFLKVLGVTSADKYRLSNTVIVPETVRIVGEKITKGGSGGVTIKTAAGVTLTNMFTVTGGSNPSTTTDLAQDTGFIGLTLDGNSTTTNIIKMTNTDFCRIDDCRFISATNSIVTVWDSNADPVSATAPGGIFLSNSIISANSGVGIDLQYQTQCWITNCWFSGTSVSTWIKIKSCNKIKLSNLEFNTATTAISLQDTSTVKTDNIVITSPIFEVGSGHKAWEDLRTNTSSKRVMATGATFGSGVTYDPLVNDQNYIVGSNTFFSQGNVTGSTTFNRTNGKMITATLTGSITVTLSSGGFVGDELVLKLTQDSTGSRTATWPSNFKKAGGSLVLSTTASSVDIISMQYDGTNWVEKSRSLGVS